MKRALKDSAILFGFALASVALGACPASLGDRCASDVCLGADGDAGPGSGGGDADADANVPVDPCITNPTDPTCIKEDEAFFVSASNGDDAAALGTKATPFKTLSAALAKVSAAKKRFYICDGTYDEDVRLSAAHAGVSLFGGVTCDWKASNNQPRFGKSNLALRLDAAKGVAIADLAFSAKDGAPLSPSSIAALVVNGATLTLQRVTLTAGKGASPQPSAPADFAFPAQSQLNGIDGASGGSERSFTCPGAASTKGGKGGPNGFAGDPGTPGPANGGSTSVCAGPGSVNTDGANGASAAPPAALTDAGELSADGWTPRPGIDGANGAPGQGGGGGFGGGGGVGGGGGAGGCGGAGGKAGRGGGASIALASFNAASLTVNASNLTAADAANGTQGLPGQPGQNPGGSRGNGSGTSCNGGNGGAGGAGAAGGGGAGGLSVGVLYKGNPPALDDDSSAATATGKKGVGGPGGPGAPPGLDGLAAPTLKAN